MSIMLPRSGRDTELWISDSDCACPNKGLLVRGFTPEFQNSQRNSLFYSFNASNVINFPYHSVVIFENQEQCFRLIRELHQRVLFTTSEPEAGKNRSGRLKVEFLQQKYDNDKSKDTPLLRPINSNYLHTSKRTTAVKDTDKPLIDASEFVFPDATSAVTKRICDIVANDKAFYYDVLLLMIKHNLQPPFENSPLKNADDSEDNDILPGSYKPYFKPRPKRPALKTGFLGSGPPPKKKKSSKNKNSTNGVFEETKIKLRKRKIVLDIPLPKGPCPSSPSSSSSLPDSSTFGTFQPSKVKVTVEKVKSQSQFDLSSLSPKDIFASSYLDEHRIPKEEWSRHSVFSNYSVGEPSQSLYIKNLNQRKVELKDLYSMYTSFINFSDPTHKDAFDIILLKSGRLRGQAFISFPNVDIARNALQKTNGFVLHGKPIVVCFSRSKVS